MTSSKYVDGDQQYLTEEQYASDNNLTERVNIHDRFGVNPYGWHRWVFDRLVEVGLGGRVLEIGAGTGDLWLRNRDRLQGDFELTLTDVSPGMVRELAAKLDAAGIAASTAVLDVQGLGAGDYDIVICNHVLYHVPDRIAAVRSLASAITDDGVVLASTNGARHMIELDELAARNIAGVEVGAFGESFGLENGYRFLVDHFDHIEMRRYPDGLVVDDADALVAYVRSLYSDASPAEIDALRADVAAALQRGPMEITKDPGLFVCRAPRPRR